MTDFEKELIKEAGLDVSDFEPKKVSQLDMIEAQAMYTALMTDTLLEVDDEEEN